MSLYFSPSFYRTRAALDVLMTAALIVYGTVADWEGEGPFYINSPGLAIMIAFGFSLTMIADDHMARAAKSYHKAKLAQEGDLTEPDPPHLNDDYRRDQFLFSVFGSLLLLAATAYGIGAVSGGTGVFDAPHQSTSPTSPLEQGVFAGIYASLFITAMSTLYLLWKSRPAEEPKPRLTF